MDTGKGAKGTIPGDLQRSCFTASLMYASGCKVMGDKYPALSEKANAAADAALEFSVEVMKYAPDFSKDAA